MKAQVVNYKTIGMLKDNSESAFDSKFAFENMNMRITARDNNTLLSLSNERGNLDMLVVNSIDDVVVTQDLYTLVRTLNDLSGGVYTISDMVMGVTFQIMYITNNSTTFIDITLEDLLTHVFLYNEGVSAEGLVITGNFKGEFTPNSSTVYPLTDLIYAVIQGNIGIRTSIGGVLTINSTALNILEYDAITMGNTTATETPILGYPIGYVVLNDTLVLFTTLNLIGTTSYNTDRIYKITKSTIEGVLISDILYEGTLNFDVLHPIEAIPFYENENIQKVYWTDNKNQMRFMNILSTETYNNNSFDFVPLMGLKEVITITKNKYGGTFPAGVILYAFSYINNYGVETSLFYTSPLYYLSNGKTGETADGSVANSFNLSISNVDTSFDKVRIYSIIRTSVNSTPVIKKIVDINTESTIAITDTGYLGETQTSTSLLYTGGEKLVAKTIALKDNTLFLGNLELLRDTAGDIPIGNTLVKDLLGVDNSAVIVFASKPMASSTEAIILDNTSSYPYEASRTLIDNDFNAKTLKYGEYYRFGILFQHKTGKWSEAIWISDALNTVLPTTVKVTSGGGFNVDITGTLATYVLGNAPLISGLVSAGYIKARGLIVYPSVNERRIIALGILNPTVYLIKSRETDSPTIQSSWFLRPMKPVAVDDFGDETTASLEGGFVEFRHNRALSGVKMYSDVPDFDPTLSRGAEIENFMYSNPYVGTVNYPLNPYISHAPMAVIDPTRDSKIDLINLYGDAFIVDSSTVTFNSPDIEFDESLWNIGLEESTLSILGLTHLTGFISNTSVTPTDAYNPDCIGFVNPSIKQFNISAANGMNVAAATPMWYDQSVTGAVFCNFVVFPWLAKRAFNDVASSTVANAPVMTSKHTSNLRFSALNTYFAPVDFTDGITTPKLFTSKESAILTLDAPNNSNLFDYNYLANIDILVAPVLGNEIILAPKFLTNYPLPPSTPDATYHIETQTGVMWSLGTGSYSALVEMKYKSTPHAVFNFNWELDGTQVALPALNSVNKETGGRLFYKEDCNESVSLLNINVSTAVTLGGGVWLADLIRPINTTTIFGGKIPTAFENNSWEIGGLPISIVDINDAPLATVTIPYTSGDTYIQRYDCLRTYPYNISDEQTMTEIVSFLCETRINLDARTDNNRGKTDNRFITPLNSNLYNDIYNQKDNYFTYRGLDYDLFSLDKFPNTFTWSDKKITGDVIDTWMNISMKNTYDVDGVYGEINALKTFNNNLIGFQDKSIFEIQYNSRIQINASDGVPIEISNSGSVDGIRYISSNAGTKNKYSIVTTPFGLYFIDDTNRSINIFNGLIISLSDKLGFHSWSNQHFKNLSEWSPVSYNNFTTHYDNINKDVYFINGTEALCYSELLGQFTSFFNYENVPYMFNNWDSLFSIKRDTTSNTIKIWELNKGEYNKFFGVSKEFYTTLMVNPYPQYDKVFNTFEFRADSWSTTDNWVTPNSPSTLKRVVDFTKLKVWDEYQAGELTLTFNNGFGSSLKLKFRSWRTYVPRVVSREYSSLEGGAVRTHPISGLDRLRNNWAYMQLYSSGLNNYLTILHDINVYYSM